MLMIYSQQITLIFTSNETSLEWTQRFLTLNLPERGHSRNETDLKTRFKQSYESVYTFS